MKIAVLSDIHGNLPALQSVAEHVDQWQPDQVVINGDVVNRGPRSTACWDFVQKRRETHSWQLVGGNHEAYVAHWSDRVVDGEGPQFEIDQSSYWTYSQLNGRVPGLLDLPLQLELGAPDGSTVRMTHGSMRGVRDGIYPQTSEAELREQIAPPPEVFCTAHTHRPLLRCLDETLIINSGSAGTSFDGDPRISYAQLTWSEGGWRATIVRLEYDRAQAAREFVTSGYLEQGGPLVQIFYQEWYLARPLINQWAARFEALVLAGEISLADAVDVFLADYV